MSGLVRVNPRRDSTEKAIRAVLHKTGVKTWALSGEGIPDLLCLIGHRLILLEIKRDSKAPLTKPQLEFQAIMKHHNAAYYVVWDPDTALEAVKLELAR